MKLHHYTCIWSSSLELHLNFNERLFVLLKISTQRTCLLKKAILMDYHDVILFSDVNEDFTQILGNNVFLLVIYYHMLVYKPIAWKNDFRTKGTIEEGISRPDDVDLITYSMPVLGFIIFSLSKLFPWNLIFLINWIFVK